ncbi:U4/U6 small nuclear ribonucleoprotein Prp4 [Rhizophlyctis rosea]|nr:U4/U6 small nuclear ribonucleoprotein Prp4 [Rhizophlyctis rosea]
MSGQDLASLLARPRIHYGSLEENDRVVRHGQSSFGQVQGVSLDDLGDDDHQDTSESAARARAEQQAILEEFERKKIAKSVAVPTSDVEVRRRLREEGEPQTLFGEGPADRRDRLRQILVRKARDQQATTTSEKAESEGEEESSEEEEEEEFYTLGRDELVDARRNIASYAIPRAKKRIAAQRAEIDIPFAQRKRVKHDWYTHVKTFETKSLQYGDERPLSYCAFSPNSKVIATASFSGTMKLWNVPALEKLHAYRGHNARVSGIDFHPQSTINQSPSALNLASGALDGVVHLWSFEKETPIASLQGHDMRVARVAFHPSGRYIGTASFDKTWRLWDAQTQQELLMQEGHSREVFAIGFQDDGSLVATGGFDSGGRVWDLRTGRSIWTLEGHVKHILCLDWSPNGYQIATGSEDNSIRIWDVRQTKNLYTIPAHKNLVTQVKYWHAGTNFEREDDGWVWPGSGDVKMGEANGGDHGDVAGDVRVKMEVDGEEEEKGKVAIGPQGRRQLLDGSLLVSSSHDGTCKVWTDGDFKPIKALTGLEGKVMNCDISSDGKYIATASYDRTFKLYAAGDVEA